MISKNFFNLPGETQGPLKSRGYENSVLSSIFTAIFLFIILIWNHDTVGASLDFSISIGICTGIGVALLYYLFPILKVLGLTLWHRKIPERQILQQFTIGQKFVCLGLIAFGMVYLFNHLYPQIQYTLFFHHLPKHLPKHWDSTKPYVTSWFHILIIWFITMLFLGFLIPMLLPKHVRMKDTRRKNLKKASAKIRKRQKIQKIQKIQKNSTIMPFGLWIGRSTGYLSSLWHKAGLAANIDVVLSVEDAAQNILVLGGIGAGKTTRVMQPLLTQLLDQNAGGLLFDIKGDVKPTAVLLSEATNQQITIIGPNQSRMNLLDSLTPEVAASFLKSAFLLGSKGNVDSFWIDTATELSRNTLGLLSFLPLHYTLQGLYGYLFDETVKKDIQSKLSDLLHTLTDQKQRLLNAYIRYHDMIFENFDDKVKSGVNATIAQVLSPFNHPELVDAFCSTKQKKQKKQKQISASQNPKMQDVLDGVIYLVDMPLSVWGLGGKVAYTFIKLRFFNVMQSRNHHPEWNQERPIFFMCDEYQEIVSANKDGLSDLNFWDKSRSSKTIGIISAQSISSFYAALGNRDLVHALLQNFRQKLCFRTEDPATLNMMDSLAGRAKVQRKTTNKTTGKSRQSWTEHTSHNSNTQSITEIRESVLDATLFRNLTQNQAAAILSLRGHAMDDVLELMPVYI